MPVHFTDNSVAVREALNDACIAYLYTAASTLTDSAKTNSSPEEYKGIQASALWTYAVDERALKASVGSPHEAGFWEELGTGEFSINFEGGASGKGRKGWWVYVEGNDTPRSNQKQYSEEEAKSVAAFLRSKGLKAHATSGRKPNRPLFRALSAKRNSLLNLAKEMLGEWMK